MEKISMSSVGGHARSKALSGKHRSAIASHAASTRWSEKTNAASTRAGNSEMRQAYKNSTSKVIKSDRFNITPDMTKRQKTSVQNRITKVRYNKKGI